MVGSFAATGRLHTLGCWLRSEYKEKAPQRGGARELCDSGHAREVPGLGKEGGGGGRREGGEF